MRLAAAALLIYSGLSCYCQTGLQVVWHHETMSARDQGLIVSHRDFESERLYRLVDNALRDCRARTYCRALFSTRETDLRELPKTYHDAAAIWRKFYPEMSSRSWQVAELLSIGTNAVVRVRDGYGKSSERIIRGSNPLKVVTAKQSYEIVLTQMTTSGSVQLFATTQAPVTKETALAFCKEARLLLPNLHIECFLADNPWFVDVPDFPIYWPFEEPRRPPLNDIESIRRYFLCSGELNAPTACIN